MSIRKKKGRNQKIDMVFAPLSLPRLVIDK